MTPSQATAPKGGFVERRDNFLRARQESEFLDKTPNFPRLTFGSAPTRAMAQKANTVYCRAVGAATGGQLMHRVLIVDDDTAFTDMVREFLELEGFSVAAVHDGNAAAVRQIDKEDLVILDVMLPGLSGFEVLKKIRQKSSLPVIMLTARGEDIDRIVGLEIGADDYVAKPVNPRELLARIRAILRRAGSAGHVPLNEIAVGDIRVNPSSRDAWFKNETLDLTSAEFNLLEHFLRNAGRIVSRDQLSAAAFGRHIVGRSIDRNVDTLVSKLRRKLSTSTEVDQRIKTVRNAGYIYTLPLAQRNAAGELTPSANAQ
jgi:DNA-binding response OmpR family regulator